MSHYKHVDYSDAVNARHLEKENTRLYKNLVEIYVRRNESVPVVTSSVKKPLQVRKKEALVIREENMRLLARILSVRSTPSLCKKELEKKHWLPFLLYKSRRYVNKSAIIENA